MRRTIPSKTHGSKDRTGPEDQRPDGDAVLELIAGSKPFGVVPEEGHAFLAGHAQIGTYKPGEIVGGEGMGGGFLFGVTSGRLRCVKFSPEGRRLIFLYMERGDWGGFYWSSDQGRAVMDVEAVETSVCVQIPGSALTEAGRRWPRLYEGLYREVLRRTRPLFGLLELSVAHPLRVRVALVLLSLLQSHQSKTAEGARLDLSINQIELAGHAFCSRQHLNRVLSEWSARGIVSVVGRRTIVVHDIDALKAEAQTSGFGPI